MALTELQLPDKATFYNEIQHAASQMNSIMNAWRDIAEFIGTMDTADLATMGVPTDVGTDLVQFRTIMQELTAFFDGTGTTQTNVPATIVDKIRRMK